jgi:hypothetical protein
MNCGHGVKSLMDLIDICHRYFFDLFWKEHVKNEDKRVEV